LRAPWEGNVRELENVMIRGILFCPEEEIRPEHVGLPSAAENNPSLLEDSLFKLDYREAKEEVLRRFHASYLGGILSHTQGNVSHAARLCGLERQGLQQLLRRYGIRSDTFRNE
jgi:DNA-binding NtrC family response regulator